MTRPTSAHLSTLTLHQLRYGELEADEEQAAHAHLEACPDCRARHGQQVAFRQAFEASPPPITLPETPVRDLRAAAPAAPGLWERMRSWLRWAPAPALALAAAAVLVVSLPGDPDPTERTKGADDVVLVVQGQGILDPGEAIQPGDRLQIRVPAGPWHEAWVGDGEQLIGSFDLDPEHATISPFALDVDGEPGDEELVIILTEEPLGEDGAAAAMRGRRMDGVLVRRLTLDKED